MKSYSIQLKVVCLSLALGLVVMAGCNKQESSSDNKPAKPAEAVNTAQMEVPAAAEKAVEKTQEEAAAVETKVEKAAEEVAEKVQEEAAPEAKAEKPAPAEAAADKAKEETTVNLRLAAADMIDGVPDKIISKCPSCALAMDGHAEFALELNGYKLYFCTENCKKKFEADPVKAVLGLKLPEK